MTTKIDTAVAEATLTELKKTCLHLVVAVTTLEAAKLAAQQREPLLEDIREQQETLLAWLLSPLVAFLQGFVLQCFWQWFILPTFGVPTPTLLTCCGLLLLTCLWRRSVETAREVNLLGETYLALGYALLLLVGGWLVHQLQLLGY